MGKIHVRTLKAARERDKQARRGRWCGGIEGREHTRAVGFWPRHWTENPLGKELYCAVCMRCLDVWFGAVGIMASPEPDWAKEPAK